MSGIIELWRSLIDALKENKTLATALLASVVLLAMTAIVIGNARSERAELSVSHQQLEQELTNLRQNIEKAEISRTQEKNDVVLDVTGLDPKLVVTDTTLAEAFFGPAFSWTNGKEYETVRQTYIDALGEGNSFTKTYLPADTVIDTNEGPLSYIDHTGLKMELDAIEIVPLTAEGVRIRYVAIVRYFPYKDSRDLTNTAALAPSQAIVRFTISGNEDESRRVSEVEAWSGFTSAIDAE